MRFLLLIFTVALFAACKSPQDRERISLNEGWQFMLVDSADINPALAYPAIKNWLLPSGNDFMMNGTAAARPEGNLDGGKFASSAYEDSQWRTVNLPHDWGIEGPFVQEYAGETAKLPWFGVAWYRKHIQVDRQDEGKRFYLDVDGAMSYAAVWCNGEFVGGWPYGYASFRVDLTPFIKVGKDNVVAIRLDNPDNSSRWYPGGGIYRNVWLVKTSQVHVGQWGTFVTATDITDNSATVNVDVNIENHSGNNVSVDVVTDIYLQDVEGNIKGGVIASSTGKISLASEKNSVSQKVTIDNPKLWDIDEPNMYQAVTTINEGGRKVDSYTTPFGIKTSEFTANDGFHLNGRRVRLQGVCMHHDLGALGAAFNYRAQERQLEILKEMGVNAIRTAHNPPAPEVLELCDRMGLLVIDEFVDTWASPKKPNGYAALFYDWHEQDMRSFMRRDRNHPSVIAWSTGNEVVEQWNEEGRRISQELTNIVHEEDPYRPSTFGSDNPTAPFNGLEYTADVFGFNYKTYLYDKFSEERPEIPFYGSETASCISTRGEYLFPVGEDKSGGKIGFHMSSYDLYAPGWASKPDVEFEAQDRAKADAGEFVWTGFDYLGEPTPFTFDMTVLTNYHNPAEKAKAEEELKAMGKITVPSRSSYFGIVDLAGFKKDRFYIYQARWRPELPMAHILPHWNWEGREGQVTPIHVYTSGDAAELFVNGKSHGMKTRGEYDYRLRWDDVKYEPGEVKVVAYRNGEKWAEDMVKTAGAATQLEAVADRQVMKADGYDLIFVTVRVLDGDGNFVPKADNLVSFSVTGPADIVATDNGDPTSHELFQNKHVKAFNGMCLVILKSKKGQAGDILLKASAEGMDDVAVKAMSN